MRGGNVPMHHLFRLEQHLNLPPSMDQPLRHHLPTCLWTTGVIRRNITDAVRDCVWLEGRVWRFQIEIRRVAAGVAGAGAGARTR